MNRYAWHIPLGILISVFAHLSLITVISGNAYWPFGSQSNSAAYGTTKQQPTRGLEMETYPTFPEPEKEVAREEPLALPKLPEIRGTEIPELSAKLRIDDLNSEMKSAKEPEKAEVILKTPGLKVEKVKDYPILFE